MAQLKDTVVSGSLRATDTIYSTTNQFQILNIPTSSNGTTYGPGTSGQVLKSNGTSVYWASDTNTDSHVTQAAAITTAGAYPIILANSTSTAAVTATVNKTSTLTYNPNTKSLVTGGTVDGYTLAAASAKAVTDSSSASAISTGTSLPTERDIYYGLPTINNAHNYTSNTKIYAPTDGGTEGQFLRAEGSTNTPAWKDLHYTDLKPIVKKTYASTDYYATDTNNENACFFFMSVKPDSWQKPWTVRFKIHTYCPNSTYVNNHSVTYSTYSGRADAFIVKNWNEVYTSAHYYTTIMLLKQAGFNAGLGHAIGINLLYANNYTTAAAYRTFEVEYYECDGCTVTLLDAPVKQANWSNYNTTNYNGFSNSDAVNRGMQESGDSYDVARLTISYPRITTGAVGIGRYTLFMRTSDGTYQSITSTFNSTGTSHVKNTALFRPERIFYRNASSDLAANNSADNNNSWMDYTPGGLLDLRYSTNCGTTLQVRKPVYLVGTINDNGFFSLADTWYTQTEPTSDDGKVYIYLGMPYTQDSSNATSSQYRIAFEFNNPIYWYKDGAFRLYEPIPPITRGGTGATSASGARTNLGITPGNIGAVATSEGVTAITWDSTNNKLTRTINGTAADVVTIATLKSALGLAKADVGLGSVTNHAQVTSLQWDTTNKKLTYKVSEGTATNLLTFAAGSNISLIADTNKITIANTYSYSLPLAASGTRGGVQIGYTTDATNRNYAVQLSSEKMYVNVPWANTYTSSICTTGASTAAKTASSSNFVLKANTYIYLVMSNANTAQSALTLNINSTGAKPVWINGVVSSSTNYTWPAGSYLIYYDGTNYYVNTDGTLFGVPSIALGKSVPEMPFTDFDNIAIPSTYRIKNTATLKTIANSPLGNSSNSGGRIITMGGYTTTDNTYLRQFFFGSYYRMWIRGQAGTGANLEWSPWGLIVTASPEGNVGDTNIPVYIDDKGSALPATGVYNKNNIIYSSTAPANPTDGMIWLKPIS